MLCVKNGQIDLKNKKAEPLFQKIAKIEFNEEEVFTTTLTLEFANKVKYSESYKMPILKAKNRGEVRSESKNKMVGSQPKSRHESKGKKVVSQPESKGVNRAGLKTNYDDKNLIQRILEILKDGHLSKI